VVNEVALPQVFRRGLQFSSVDIIPPMVHIRLLRNASIRSRKVESLGPSKTVGVLEIESVAHKVYSLLSFCTELNKAIAEKLRLVSPQDVQTSWFLANKDVPSGCGWKFYKALL